MRSNPNPCSRTWAQSRGENWEASEISLSHRVGSSVSVSYARSDMLALRRELMQRYAEALGLEVPDPAGLAAA